MYPVRWTTFEFLDVENHPYLTFKSKRVEVIDATNCHLVGDLAILDLTKEVALDVTYNGQAKSPWGTLSAGFSAQPTINRKDWNLTRNQALETGGVLVGDEVKIALELEIIKQADPAAA